MNTLFAEPSAEQRDLWDKARRELDQAGLLGERVAAYLDSLGRPPQLATGQRPNAGYFPGLRAKPWWQQDDAPELSLLCDGLRAAHAELTNELLTHLGEASFTPYGPGARYPKLAQGEWTALPLYQRGEVVTRLPCAAGLLQGIQSRLVGEAAYLRLAAGSRLPMHADHTNAQLTCQLGMLVPRGAGLEVAGEARQLAEGDVWLFDHSYPHHAWNDGPTPRVVLLLDLAHPDLTPRETNALQTLSRLGF